MSNPVGEHQAQRTTTTTTDARSRPPRLTMVGRALLLRCPRCGGRGIWRSWFKLLHACPTCGLAFDRGESDDYWLGAYMFNLVAAELVSVATAAIVIVAFWPHVPWNFVWALAVVLALAMPVLFFPFARDLWLAFDLMFRPTGAGDEAHHQPPPNTH